VQLLRRSQAGHAAANHDSVVIAFLGGGLGGAGREQGDCQAQYQARHFVVRAGGVRARTRANGDFYGPMAPFVAVKLAARAGRELYCIILLAPRARPTAPKRARYADIVYLPCWSGAGSFRHPGVSSPAGHQASRTWRVRAGPRRAVWRHAGPRRVAATRDAKLECLESGLCAAVECLAAQGHAGASVCAPLPAAAVAVAVKDVEARRKERLRSRVSGRAGGGG
jgi:hypothetical protein